MRMYNPDGSEAEMCGNGLRCFVRWLHDRGEVAAGPVGVQTGAGRLVVTVSDDGQFEADMGPPRLAPAAIPLSPAAAAGQPPAGPVLSLPIPLDGQQPAIRPGSSAPSAHLSGPVLGPQSSALHPAVSPVRSPLLVTPVSMGNPHAVLFVDDAAAFPLERLGPVVERHPYFPARANFEVCQVLAPDRLRVRVWERGAGLTLACGTGACAAAVAARLQGFTGEQVAVELPGGVLRVAWPGLSGGSGTSRPERELPHLPHVRLSGPTVHVFDGIWQAPIRTVVSSGAVAQSPAFATSRLASVGGSSDHASSPSL
jgi:diaminopimelate epimerase